MKHYNLDDNILLHARTDFVRIGVSLTVEQAIDYVRETQPECRIVYFYVVDSEGVLTGVLPTRRLLMSPPDTPVKSLMLTRLISVPETATLLDACELFVMHRLLALPVLDGAGRIVGVVDVEIYTDEITHLAHKEESEDFFQLIGVRLAEVRQASVAKVFRNRFPWLLCNVAGGLLAALIAGLFQETLDKIVALALFVPVVLALAESVSIQSLSLSLQAHHSKRQRGVREVVASLFRELPVGLALGFSCAVLVGGAGWLWSRELAFSLVLLASILLSVATAAILGLLVPAVLRMIQTDPRIASGPITLALTDIVTLLVYLGLATRVLG